MGLRILQAEVFLRFFSLVVSLMTACLLGLDKQTEVVVVQREATVKDMPALWILTLVASVVVGYYFVQLSKSLIFVYLGKHGCGDKKWAWLCLAFDQALSYTLLAVTATAMQVSLIALTGEEELQWMKLTHFFKRFQHQASGGLLCAVVASGATMSMSIFSAYQCFNLYCSKSKF